MKDHSNTKNKNPELKQKGFISYASQSVRDAFLRKLVSIMMNNGFQESQNAIEVKQIEGKIRDNVTRIREFDSEGADLTEKALDSILLALKFLKINIGSDMLDFTTLQQPLISGITSLSIIPTAVHRYARLNKRLKKVQEYGAHECGIANQEIHKTGFADAYIEGLDFIIEVLGKIFLQAVPLPAKQAVPMLEILVSLNTGKEHYNSLIELLNFSETLLHNKKESSQ